MRISFKSLTALAVLMMVLAACGGPSAPAVTQATQAPVLTAAPAQTIAAAATTAAATEAATTAAATEVATTAAATEVATTAAPEAAATTAVPPAALSAGPLKDVPRNHTLVLAFPGGAVLGVTNPWATGYTHQDGGNFMWEGLAYYGIFADKEIPWLAESMTYNADFTQLKIKLRKEAMWSDGQPLTSKDVIYTFDQQMKNEKLAYHGPFTQSVKDFQADDDQNITVNFKSPSPRFKFEVLTLKFDTGIPILPEHALSKQPDVTAFQGGLDLPHSGPYTIVQWDKNQKIYDLRPDWWATKAAIAGVPDVKRVVMVLVSASNMDAVALRVVNNELDSSSEFRSAVIGNILKQNPKITTHTGNTPPFGYVDWWPNSLFVNTQQPPYNDVRVRRAMSLVIDRDAINENVYDGAKVTTIYPFPLYPALQKFVDSPAVKALEAKYQPGKFDLDQSAQLMTAAGFKKNADGLWEKDGKTVNATINGFEQLDSDIAPVLVEMLKKGGFDASTDFSPDAYQHMVDGTPGVYLYGHGGSLRDPYTTLEFFHSRNSPPPGKGASDGRWSRYANPEYDKLIDDMAPRSADDPKFQADATQAMEIYWRDVIDIPVIQWLHRIPYNQTNWTNWPTKANPAAGVNGTFIAQTGMLVVTNLKAVSP